MMLRSHLLAAIFISAALGCGSTGGSEQTGSGGKASSGGATGSTGNGGTSNLMGEMLKTMAKIDVLNIPYKGAGQALNDTVAGHVQFQVNTLLAALPFIQSARLRAIGVCINCLRRKSNARLKLTP